MGMPAFRFSRSFWQGNLLMAFDEVRNEAPVKSGNAKERDKDSRAPRWLNRFRIAVVNMRHHDYREEPNVRFSPNKTMVFFTSNLFGASYVFGVEVKAENPAATDVKDTAVLWRPRHHSVAIGCQSSTRFPSGSVIQPNFPKS